MRERADGNILLLYLILEADRRLVTALASLVFFVVLVAIGLFHPTPADILLTRDDPVETLFQALTAGIITAVTLVVTLSQLILSQELRAVGDQRNRMDGSLSFRSDVADAIGRDISPAEPSAFLGALVTAMADQARAVQAALEDPTTESDRFRNYLEVVAADEDRVSARLEGAEFGSFDVLNASLDFYYSRKPHARYRLHASEDDALSSEARDMLVRLTSTLSLYGPARGTHQDAVLPLGTHEPLPGYALSGDAGPNGDDQFAAFS